MPKKLRFRKLDGKFSHDGTCIVNTVSGEAIPADEPIFILRGRDTRALAALVSYKYDCVVTGCNQLHLDGIEQAVRKFKWFKEQSPERMKQPGVTRHLRLEEVSDPTCEHAHPARRRLAEGAGSPVVTYCADCGVMLDAN
jgi:hypothetical protein